MEVQGKVTIITGASTGIGRATARLFAENGAKVVLAARSTDKLADLALELRGKGREVLAVPTDVASEESVRHLVEKTLEAFGRVDILINNAGLGASGTLADYPPEAYRQLIDINVLGPFFGMQAVVPSMRQQGGGIILNISSSATKQYYPLVGAYTSTKHALNSLSIAERDELAPANIRVITMYPDYTLSDFSKNALSYGERPVAGAPIDSAQSALPLGDSPEDVAAKILEAAINEPAEQSMR